MTPPFVVCGKTSFKQTEDDQDRNCEPKGNRVLPEKPEENERCNIWEQQQNREFSLVSQKAIFFEFDSHPLFDR